MIINITYSDYESLHIRCSNSNCHSSQILDRAQATRRLFPRHSHGISRRSQGQEMACCKMEYGCNMTCWYIVVSVDWSSWTFTYSGWRTCSKSLMQKAHATGICLLDNSRAHNIAREPGSRTGKPLSDASGIDAHLQHVQTVETSLDRNCTQHAVKSMQSYVFCIYYLPCVFIAS